MTMASKKTSTQPRGYTIPSIDISDQTQRQVIVDEVAGTYLGQPDTVLLRDNKTILVGYPLGHGGPNTVLKRSDDGGLTWSDRLPVPENFTGQHNAPSLHRLQTSDGGDRLLLNISYPCMALSSSEDEGTTWTPLRLMFPDHYWNKPGFKGHAPIKSILPISDHRYLAMYHDHLRGNKVVPIQTVTHNGGLTWSEPRTVGSHPEYPDAQPCEPALIKSPDGKQLVCICRENSRRCNSLIMVSDDEGETWSELREAAGALTGDRHMPCYGPDGRLVITFRDMAHETPTYGDFVAWVGTYQDIVQGKEGQYRVRLLNNRSKPGDTGYAGLVNLPDGTFVSTTYCVLKDGASPLVVSVRFTLSEIDGLAS